MTKEELGNFENEIQIQQNLSHQNIVRIFDHEVWEGKFYMVFEICENQMLYFYSLDNKHIRE